MPLRALLGEEEFENISFRDIAKRAGVPEGSAYHFFANRFDIFTELANLINREFVEAHRKPVPPSKRKTFVDLAEYMVELGAKMYAKRPRGPAAISLVARPLLR